MATYGYCRVSTVKQLDGLSLDVQRRQLEGYAMIHGLTFTRIVCEEGVSGSIPITERPLGGALLAMLQQGDILVAPKLDRLFRSSLDALRVVEDMKARSVSLHLLDLGGDVNANGLSKLFLTIAAAFAEAERDRIRERIIATKADHKAQGRFLGGSVPFGYRVAEGVLEPHEGEQSAIKTIIEFRGQGESLRSIASKIAEKGYKISHVGVKNVLESVNIQPNG